MAMTKEEAREFINDIIPIVRIATPAALSTLSEDFEALELALTSGNDTLVFAMAMYISQVEGLCNGVEIQRMIVNKVFNM